MVAAALVIAIIPGAADRLQLDRSDVLQRGSLWQFGTCHWTHWSMSHLFWDCLALGVLASVCERENRTRFRWCIAVSVPVIPLVLWFTEAWMLTYRGLSGIDSALFVLLVTMLIRDAVRRGDRLGLACAGLVFAGFMGKVGYEFLAGQTVFVDNAASGMVPVPMAHVVGAVIGLLCGALPRLGPCGSDGGLEAFISSTGSTKVLLSDSWVKPKLEESSLCPQSAVQRYSSS